MKFFKKTYFGLAWVFILSCFVPFRSYAGSEELPRPAVLLPNIEFWKRIYTEFDSSRTVIHDKLNPLQIYIVLDFSQDEQDESATSLRKRRKAEKHVCLEVKKALKRLAAGQGPCNELDRRILQAFGEPPSRKELEEAARNVRSQRGLRDRFLEGVVRSGAYLPEMKRIFRSYGLPEELCYLPHVESSFNVLARSKCGAAGMWQFMRGTGRRFLKINYLVDERLDPFESTRAAAELLWENYDRLGSWPLAITAYNHGAAGMERALERHGSFEKIIAEYKGKRFRFASRNFYAEFLAAVDVAQQLMDNAGDEPAPEGVMIEKPLLFVTARMPGYAEFTRLATMLDIPPAELQRLNPALRKPVLAGEKYIPAGYALKLPLLSANSLSLALAETGHGRLFMARQKPSRFYRVRPGDTAHLVARKHGISLKKLASTNNLDKRYTIYAGQYLKLPF